jgi:hypothetical protein
MARNALAHRPGPALVLMVVEARIHWHVLQGPVIGSHRTRLVPSQHWGGRCEDGSLLAGRLWWCLEQSMLSTTSDFGDGVHPNEGGRRRWVILGPRQLISWDLNLCQFWQNIRQCFDGHQVSAVSYQDFGFRPET